MASLNLFPARAAIGTVTIDGVDYDSFMTPEFFRALTALFERVGGPAGNTTTTIEILAATAENQAVDLSPFVGLDALIGSESPAAVAQASQQIFDLSAQQISEAQALMAEANKAIADLQAQLLQSSAMLSESAKLIEDLQAQLFRNSSIDAEAAKSIESLNVMSGYSDLSRVNWERPGAIGSLTPNAGTFTAITTAGGAQFHTTNTALTNGAGAAAGTITNAPSAGNPTKWIGINDNGTVRYIPAW